jgi:GDP-L-fucose synthase
MEVSMDASDPIYVAGHQGMVGRAIVRKLQRLHFSNIITATRSELDLRDQHAVEAFFRDKEPAYVFLCAATVGGIRANQTRPAEFITDNLQIVTNVVTSSRFAGVKKLLFMGSSCAYPVSTELLREDDLLSGKPEETNRAYAVAKIAGIEMCDAYRKQYGCDYVSVMPCNLYGPWDNFDREASHLVPGMIAAFDAAMLTGMKAVRLWGDGSPLRELMYVDDLAEACVDYVMPGFSDYGPINIGSGMEHSVREIAMKVRQAFGLEHVQIEWNVTMPNGAPRKLLDSKRIWMLGWSPLVGIDLGLSLTAEFYRSQ